MSASIEGKALAGLLKFIEEHQRRHCRDEDGFEAFEREVHKRFNDAEREYIGEELEQAGRHAARDTRSNT